MSTTLPAAYEVAVTPPKSRNLPNRILRAYDAAKHVAGLPRSVKDTLAELVRFVSQSNPFTPVFAHKTTIAERIGADERTVYRHLAVLKDRLLIEMLPQARKSRNGKFAVTNIRLTRKAAALLGFIKPEPGEFDDPENMVIHKTPCAKMSCGQGLTEPTNTENQPASRLTNGLPTDLSWLTGNGLSRPGVFKLMALATQAKKHLSDIVVATSTYLKPLKGGHLYSYLAKLIAGPTDFTMAAMEARTLAADAEEREHYEHRARLFRARFRRATLVDRGFTRLYRFDENVRYVSVQDNAGETFAPLNDLRTWIAAVESGRLVLSTDTAERAVLARRLA